MSTPVTAELPLSFRHLSMAGGVRAACQRNPDKVVYKHGERTRTYGAFMERVDRVSAGVTGAFGLKPGDHGAIVAKNSIEYMEIVFGASQAGIALATVNPKLSAGEIVKRAAQESGGGGGGRPQMAQGGGRDAGRLEQALQCAVKLVEERK